MHSPQDIIRIFDACFFEKYNTRLCKGGDEPLYVPAGDTCNHHAIYFAHGFYSSALHEIAHWLVAGPARRLQVDFGYWYAPDGRTSAQQLEFQQVEVKPQALEWVLSMAVGLRFQVSLDNLTGEPCDAGLFKAAVRQQVKDYCTQGLPPRARKLRAALCAFYQRDAVLRYEDFVDACG